MPLLPPNQQRQSTEGIDIQSEAAEISRGKKRKKEGNKETTGQKYNSLSCCIGRP